MELDFSKKAIYHWLSDNYPVISDHQVNELWCTQRLLLPCTSLTLTFA